MFFDIAVLHIYWLIFYHKVIKNPYILAYGEALDSDFPFQVQRGRCWIKGKIPSDDGHFGMDFVSASPGSFYPVNIIFGIFMACIYKEEKDIDKAFIIHAYNIILHGLFTSIFAYFLFGNILGAVLWGYCAYHIKNQLWYVQSFTWITATILFLSKGCYGLAGLAYGMLILSGSPPMVLYFTYLSIPWLGGLSFFTGLMVGSYQIYRYYAYGKKATQNNLTYEEKTEVGKVGFLAYLMMFIPVRFRTFIYDCGFEETAYYITPLCLIGFLSKNWLLWSGIVLCYLLSRGGFVFRIFGKLTRRFPQRWGYFVSLGFIWSTMAVLEDFGLSVKQGYALTSIAMILAYFNENLLYLFPSSQPGKRPSYYFNRDYLKFLKGKLVNNLPYPVDRGILNGIKTLGYTGGWHLTELESKLGIPRTGIGRYNWFDYKDGKAPFQYHYGTCPSGWKPTQYKNIWENPYYE